MEPAFYLAIASLLLGVASFACYVTVVVQMFVHDESGWGIACLVLICCGGPLIAFIFGWIRAGDWECGLLMIAWSAAIVFGIVLRVMMAVMFGPTLA